MVKVLDFGLSKLVDAEVTGEGTPSGTSVAIGSPRYESPEQLRGARSTDVRTDVWSLGVVAYELLTRRLPFAGDDLVEILEAIEDHAATPIYELRPDVPLLLDHIVRRCLRPDRDDRYTNVLLLAKDLVPFGTERARASLDRLREHVSARGLSFEDLSATLPVAEGRAGKTSGVRARASGTPSIKVRGTRRPSDAPADRWTSARTLRPPRPARFAGLGGATIVVVGVVVALALGLRAHRVSRPRERRARLAACVPAVDGSDGRTREESGLLTATRRRER